MSLPNGRHRGGARGAGTATRDEATPAPNSQAADSFPTSMVVLRGIAVSPGVAIGPPRVLMPRAPRLIPRTISRSDVPTEILRLERGLAAALAAAEAAERDARSRLEPQFADILAAHVRMIADASLRADAGHRVERDHLPAELAVFEVLDAHARRLESLPTSHLAARAADIRDIQTRILDQFIDRAPSDSPADPVILLAPDLSPSETAALDPSLILGFATEAGGRASHTAIVAAALEIPAVVGLGRFLHDLPSCSMLIVDGDEGLVVLEPDPDTLDHYRKAQTERAERFLSLAREANLPARTRDGTRISLMGNIEFPAEAAACSARGADGIGLYRTEFLYMQSERPPTELEQASAYEAVVRALDGRPVIIRTQDLGSDKLAPDGQPPTEANPSLGLRSLRRSLREPEEFRAQLRAILRAAACGDVRVMFPLVTTVGEVRRARSLLEKAREELRAQGVDVPDRIQVGAMIEVPAAAVVADLLAKEVDFFSIGTNDLIQYTLAADRTNETLADLYCAADPAVLRLIARVAAAAREASIEVGVCGSIAGEPLYTLPLLGLGVHQLSTPPHQLPEIKRLVRTIDLGHATAVAQAALRCATADEVLALLRDELRRVSPDSGPTHSGLMAALHETTGPACSPAPLSSRPTNPHR